MTELSHYQDSLENEVTSSNKHRSVSSDRHGIRSRLSQSQSTPNFRKHDTAHKSNPTLVKGDFMPKQLQALETNHRANFRQQRASKMNSKYHWSNTVIAPSTTSSDENSQHRNVTSAAEKSQSSRQNTDRSRSLTLHNIRDLLLSKTRERLFQTNKQSSNSNSYNFYQSRHYRNQTSPTQTSNNTTTITSVLRTQNIAATENRRPARSSRNFSNKENNEVLASVERDENEPFNGSPYRRPGGFGFMPKSRSFHSMKTNKADEYFFTLAAQMSVAKETDL